MAGSTVFVRLERNWSGVRSEPTGQVSRAGEERDVRGFTIQQQIRNGLPNSSRNGRESG